MGELKTPEVKPTYRQSLAVFCERLLAEDPRLVAYSNNYRGGHLRALETTFPVTGNLLGLSVFRSLAQAYLDHFPPQHWDLNLFGEQLPDLIAAQVHGGRGGDTPWTLIAHIAHIEYAMTRAYYAPDGDDDAGQTLLIPGLNTPHECRNIASELSAAHPYARVAPALSLELTVQVWRADGQVRVDQLTPPSVARQS